ncbi:ammonium transporter [Erythrobacteraceae bacterium E2-1 Yellow Sea]|nr:ammonium transporter [Erythrobacteraceae bacterium E2-1 Yellow Sea]
MEISALTAIFTEFYYWVTIPLMFLIHGGFCLYEVSVSRQKHMLHTLMKSAMLVPIITLTFYLFGWWIYFAFTNGPFIYEGKGLVAAPHAVPWSELMGPHLGGPSLSQGLTPEVGAYWARLNGVFWGAFVVFAWTAGIIVSGAVMERIRSGAFWLIATVVGSVSWVIGASWGWHYDGWMVKMLGYHDAYASGVIHAVAGGAALGILIPLGPRLGRFAPNGSPRTIHPHNPWLAAAGLFLIFAGFWGFYAACNVPIIQESDIGSTGLTFTAATIYLTPVTLSGMTMNFFLALSGGFLAAYVLSKGDVFWTFSGGLAGVIAASAGNDLYHPLQAFFVGAAGTTLAYKLHYWVEKTFKLDDAIGAVAVHGYTGSFGIIIAGFMLWGHPSSAFADATINPVGQIAGAVILFGLLGFLPAFLCANLFKAFGLLRIPPEVEWAGLDRASQELVRQDMKELERADAVVAAMMYQPNVPGNSAEEAAR